MSAKAEHPATCGECHLFNPVTPYERVKAANGERAEGQCRYYAPSPNSYPVFPHVHSDEVACRQGQKAEVG